MTAREKVPTSCDNPRCTCSPCTCGTGCRCGDAKLGDLERRVMDVLWDQPGQELSGRDVAGFLPRYAYTTVATVLDRLTHKGLVQRRKDGRIIRFKALDTGSALAAQAIREALDATSDPTGALSRFVEEADPVELAALRRALTARSGGHG